MVYWRIINNENWEPLCIKRWSKLLSKEFEQTLWAKFFEFPFRICRDTALRVFQWKIVHGSLITNIQLKQYGIIETESCSFCRADRETLEHLFMYCPLSKQLWNDFIKWLPFEISFFNIDICEMLFGNFSPCKERNFLELLIFCTRGFYMYNVVKNGKRFV